jgi:VIT1/CCC1 family predicted Fe2+/Mn2+ transporter
MSNHPPHRWATARLALGFLQMFGAVFSATLIVQSGLTSLALIAALITGLLTLLNVGLFGGVISGMLPKRCSKSHTGRKA